MKRVAIIADSHFDEHSRFQECVRVHDWIAADIERRGVDLVLHSGDVFERKSTPAERRAVADWLIRVATIAPVVIVRGNHDALDDLLIFAKLETRHRIVVVQNAAVHVVGGFVIGCLAWPTKGSVLALGAESSAEGEQLASEALRNVLRGLGQQMSELAAWDSVPRILLAHAMVRGSMTSTGQPLIGCDLEVGLEDLALARADFVALGHVHKSQHWPGLASETGDYAEHIVYPGSPRRTAFGEIEKKGYVLASFDGEQLSHWALIETPCAPMLLLEDEWGSSHGWESDTCEAALEHENLTGAEVRFRYTVDADRRDEAREAAGKVAADLLAAGAIEVKVEPVVKAAGVARAPEVARATTLPEKLSAYWSARGTAPEAPRAERLLGKARDLEVRDAV